jgi:hypothetical protein
MYNHKAHNEQLQMLVVVYYVLNHMYNQLVLMMHYRLVDKMFDLQLLLEHRQQQLMLDKHKL